MRNIEKIMYNRIMFLLKKKGFVFHGSHVDFIKIELARYGWLFLDIKSGAVFSIKTVNNKSETTWYYRDKETIEPELKESELKELITELNKWTG